ncbi:MAG: MFS transporter [Halioglobus sp.]
MSKQALSLAGTAAASPLGFYSWTLGQAARDPYYIIVVIYIFYPYFSSTVVGDPVRGQALIGYLGAVGGVLLALMAPILGAIADKHGRRKPWIACATCVMAVGSACLWFVEPNSPVLGVYQTLLLLLVVIVAFTISELFHNAMLPAIAPAARVGEISGIAFALGNWAGLFLMLFILIAFALPGTDIWPFVPQNTLFGIDQSLHEHNRIVGPIAAVWMLVFTLPVLLFTPDVTASSLSIPRAIRQGVADAVATITSLKHYSNIALFLLSRMFFFDGMVGVMTFVGIYAAGTFSWDTSTLLIFGLCSSGSAMFGAYIGGRIDDWLGSARTLKVAITFVTIIILFLASIQPDSILYGIPLSTEKVWDFPYFQTPAELIFFATNQISAMFFVTGLSSSRSLMARISPPSMSAQFFGLYALSGTVTAFLAPLLVATFTDWFDSQQLGFASLSLLLIIGGVLLTQVKEEQGTPAS